MIEKASAVGAAAAKVAVHEAALHVHEQGGNNRGPQVRQFLAAAGLGEGYAWCCAFVVWCFLQAGCKIIDRTAGVAAMWAWAQQKGYLVARPYRGDIVLFNFYGAPGAPPADHAGIVARVLSIRLLGRWYLRTIEGNTAADAGGSQADGDGVYVKRRLVARNRVAFVRIPG